MKEQARPLNNGDITANPGPAEEAGRTLDEACEQAGEDIQKP
ncbi:MAG: hypothetical protein Q8L71_09410 [Thiobacillus sp.]|nr:hypothetical protein [Thiobacillus sp.]